MKQTGLSAIFSLLALSPMAAMAHADEVQYSGAPMVTLYGLPNFAGRKVVLRADNRKLKNLDFAAKAMSMKVSGGRWEVCDRKHYKGACEVFGPGDYNLGRPGWSQKIKSVRRFDNDRPEIVLFSLPNMGGEHHSWTRNFSRAKDFLSRASVRSVKVKGGAWTLCDRSKGKGHCETIDEDVRDLAVFQLGGRLFSVFRAKDWNEQNGIYQGSDAYGPGSSMYGQGQNGTDSAHGGVEGQGTVFFARPAWRGRPVSSRRYDRNGVTQADADAFCRAVGLGRAVYFDETRQSAQPFLADVLCLR